MTIAEARALAASINERVRSQGSSETQNADVGRLANAGAAIADLCNTLADQALAKAAYDAEQARVKAEEAAVKKAEADAKKAEADAKHAADPESPNANHPNRLTLEAEPVELSVDREREAAAKKKAAAKK